jgi:hypothetical protein
MNGWFQKPNPAVPHKGSLLVWAVTVIRSGGRHLKFGPV